MVTLDQMSVGSTGTIKRIHGKGAARKRLLDLGFTKGTEVSVRKLAPLGDPVEVTVRGTEVTVRKSDAQAVELDA